MLAYDKPCPHEASKALDLLDRKEIAYLTNPLSQVLLQIS